MHVHVPVIYVYIPTPYASTHIDPSAGCVRGTSKVILAALSVFITLAFECQDHPAQDAANSIVRMYEFVVRREDEELLRVNPGGLGVHVHVWVEIAHDGETAVHCLGLRAESCQIGDGRWPASQKLKGLKATDGSQSDACHPKENDATHMVSM